MRDYRRRVTAMEGPDTLLEFVLRHAHAPVLPEGSTQEPTMKVCR
jgi:hypothetical protein